MNKKNLRMKVGVGVAAIVIVALLIFNFAINNGDASGGVKKDDEYSVKFDSDGGSTVKELFVKKGEPVEKPADPTKENYSFLEWDLNGSSYDFSKPVSEDITLVAKWQEADAGTNGDGGSGTGSGSSNSGNNTGSGNSSAGSGSGSTNSGVSDADLAKKFLADNRAVLDLTVDTVQISDKAGVQTVLNKYNALSSGVKTQVDKLEPGIPAHLQELLSRIAAEEEAQAFVDKNKSLINIDLSNLSLSSAPKLLNQLLGLQADYNSLDSEVKGLVDVISPDLGSFIDSLLSKLVEIHL